jgi:uncharacterized protein YhfF
MTEAEAAFWAAFLASGAAPPEAASRYFESCAIGNDAAAADAGARLILSGRKTVTSALPSEFPIRPPRPGDLSILLDGARHPVAVFDTVATWTATLADADATLAAAYAEWPDLPTFRSALLVHYRAGDPGFGLASPLLFERFRLAWAPGRVRSSAS